MFTVVSNGQRGSMCAGIFLLMLVSLLLTEWTYPPDDHYHTGDSEKHDRHGLSILFLTTLYSFKNKPFAHDQPLSPFTELFILLILLNGFYTGSYFSFVLYQRSLVHLTQHYLGLKVLWISVSNTTCKPTQRQVIEGSQYILLYRGRLYQS